MSGYDRPVFKAAAVQAAPVLKDAPVYMDVRATLDKACGLIKQAGLNGAKLIVFPEAFLPTFPYWSIMVGRETHEWTVIWKEYVNNSVEVPGPETEALCRAAKEAGAYLVMGINERDKQYGGRMYNSALFISPSEGIMGIHRKLHPTLAELLYHTRGDGGDNIKAYQTNIGKVGSLICGEHIQFALLHHMVAQGEEINCSLWPGSRTWGPKGKAAYVLDTEIQVMTRAVCIAGAMYSVAASACIPEELRPKHFYPNNSFERSGGSCIVDPIGEYVAGPVYDVETIVYGDIDPGKIAMSKSFYNLLGMYSRWDLFSLAVRQKPYEPEIPLEHSERIIQEREPEKIKQLDERIKALERQLQAIKQKKAQL